MWEWVQDCYVADYYNTSPDDNPVNTQCNYPDQRVLRGGSWVNEVFSIRVSDRYWESANRKSSHNGFRCALSP